MSEPIRMRRAWNGWFSPQGTIAHDDYLALPADEMRALLALRDAAPPKPGPYVPRRGHVIAWVGESDAVAERGCRRVMLDGDQFAYATDDRSVPPMGPCDTVTRLYPARFLRWARPGECAAVGIPWHGHAQGDPADAPDAAEPTAEDRSPPVGNLDIIETAVVICDHDVAGETLADGVGRMRDDILALRAEISRLKATPEPTRRTLMDAYTVADARVVAQVSGVGFRPELDDRRTEAARALLRHLDAPQAPRGEE